MPEETDGGSVLEGIPPRATPVEVVPVENPRHSPKTVYVEIFRMDPKEVKPKLTRVERLRLEVKNSKRRDNRGKKYF